MHFFAAIPKAYLRPDLPFGDYLISAAAFFSRGKLRVPKFIPEANYFVDCGAYSMRSGLLFSWKEYTEFAAAWKPVAVAVFDRPGDAAWTGSFMQENHLSMVSSSLPFVPVITGNTPEEYREAFQLLVDLLNSGSWKPIAVAIGNLKGRKDARRIFELISEVPASDLAFHLFGGTIQQIRIAKTIADFLLYSVDSSCWNGRFPGVIDNFNAIMKATGKTQRAVAVDVMLPQYREKILSAARPVLQQHSLHLN